MMIFLDHSHHERDYYQLTPPWEMPKKTLFGRVPRPGRKNHKRARPRRQKRG